MHRIRRAENRRANNRDHRQQHIVGRSMLEHVLYGEGRNPQDETYVLYRDIVDMMLISPDAALKDPLLKIQNVDDDLPVDSPKRLSQVETKSLFHYLGLIPLMYNADPEHKRFLRFQALIQYQVRTSFPLKELKRQLQTLFSGRLVFDFLCQIKIFCLNWSHDETRRQQAQTWVIEYYTEMLAVLYPQLIHGTQKEYCSSLLRCMVEMTPDRLANVYLREEMLQDFKQRKTGENAVTSAERCRLFQNTRDSLLAKADPALASELRSSMTDDAWVPLEEYGHALDRFYTLQRLNTWQTHCLVLCLFVLSEAAFMQYRDFDALSVVTFLLFCGIAYTAYQYSPIKDTLRHINEHLRLTNNHLEGFKKSDTEIALCINNTELTIQVPLVRDLPESFNDPLPSISFVSLFKRQRVKVSKKPASNTVPTLSESAREEDVLAQWFDGALRSDHPCVYPIDSKTVGQAAYIYIPQDVADWQPQRIQFGDKHNGVKFLERATREATISCHAENYTAKLNVEFKSHSEEHAGHRLLGIQYNSDGAPPLYIFLEKVPHKKVAQTIKAPSGQKEPRLYHLSPRSDVASLKT